MMLLAAAINILVLSSFTVCKEEVRMNPATIESFKRGLLQCINLLRRHHNVPPVIPKTRKEFYSKRWFPKYMDPGIQVPRDIEDLNLDSMCRVLYCRKKVRNLIVWKALQCVEITTKHDYFVIHIVFDGHEKYFNNMKNIRENVLPCNRPNECE
ncbi:hypothetical protein ACOME3_000323 [Neoechinorhynchus agilis]